MCRAHHFVNTIYSHYFFFLLIRTGILFWLQVFFGRRKDCDVRLVLGESIDGGCAVRVVLERQLCAYDPTVSISSGLATEL